MAEDKAGEGKTGEEGSQGETYTKDQVEQMIADATGGLKSKVDELLGEKKSASAKAKEAEEQARKAAEEAARKSGDLEALEAKMTERFQAKEQEIVSDRDKWRSEVEKLTAGAAAQKIASEVAVQGGSEALASLLGNRIKTELTEEGARVAFLGPDGKVATFNPDEFKTQIRGESMFKALILDTKADGGGAASPNGGAGKAKTVTRETWNQMGQGDRMTFSKEGGKVVDA